MGFRISHVGRHQFEDMMALDDDALAARGMKRYVADRKPGFPCRVSLQDAEPGERVILVPFQHQAAESPYRASGPIFVREAAVDADLAPNVVPGLLRLRLLSLRVYDAAHLMIDADVADGRELEPAIERLLDNREASYLHVHFARPGCYACRVDRA